MILWSAKGFTPLQSLWIFGFGSTVDYEMEAHMKRSAPFYGFLALLAGCGSVQNTTYTPIMLNGQEKTLKTATMTQNGKTIERYSVQAKNGKWVSCDVNGGGCAAAARSSGRSTKR